MVVRPRETFGPALNHYATITLEQKLRWPQDVVILQQNLKHPDKQTITWLHKPIHQ